MACSHRILVLRDRPPFPSCHTGRSPCACEVYMMDRYFCQSKKDMDDIPLPLQSNTARNDSNVRNAVLSLSHSHIRKPCSLRSRRRIRHGRAQSPNEVMSSDLRLVLNWLTLWVKYSMPGSSLKAMSDSLLELVCVYLLGNWS